MAPPNTVQSTRAELRAELSPGRLATFTQMVSRLMVENRDVQLEATTSLRLFVYNPSTPLDDVTQTPGLVGRLVEFFSSNDFEDLKHEAADVLASLTQSQATQVLVDEGIVPLFVQLLNDSDREDDTLRAVWALGNIASESVERRDYVLNCEAMTPLLAQFNGEVSTHLLRKATWMLSQLCKGNPRPHIEQTAEALPVLVRLLSANQHYKVLVAAFSSLLSLTIGSNNQIIQRVVDLGVIPRVLELANYSEGSLNDSGRIQRAAVGLIRNIAMARNHHHIRLFVELGSIELLCNFLTHSERNPAFWAMNTIAIILGVGRAENNAVDGEYFLYKTRFMDAGGVVKMEAALRTHHGDSALLSLNETIVGYLQT